jgi:hypothetical protein
MKAATQIILAFAILALGWHARPDCPTIETRADTIIVRDTIREMVPIVKHSLTTRVDTVWVKIAGDTVYMAAEIPIERKVYQTTDYRAEIEGFRPELLSMEIYRRTQYITTAETVRVSDNRRWGLGLQAGYGFSARDGRVVMSPYIGLGVSYDIFRW